jgi:flagellar assembly factor FliW
MAYEVRHQLPGFEKITNVEIERSEDGLTSVLRGCGDDCIELSLINASITTDGYDIPDGIATLLDINENSNVSVYFVVVIAEDINNSTINLGAPIIVNEDNHTLAQAVMGNEHSTLSDLI